MSTFDMLEKINAIFGHNHLSGTPEQQKINRDLARLLREYDESMKNIK